MTASYGVLDIETDGGPFDGRLLVLGWRGGSYTPDELERTPDGQLALRELSDPKISKVVFTKYDHRWLRLKGIEVAGPIEDVQTMCWTMDETTDLDLESCALRYSGIVMDKRLSRVGERVLFRCDDGSVVPIGDAPLDQLRAYNVRDLEATEVLYLDLLRKLGDAGQLDYWRTMHAPFTPVLVDMECRGLPLSPIKTRAAAKDLRQTCARLETDLRSTGFLPASFNLNSPAQLINFLFTKEFEHDERLEPGPEEIKRIKVEGTSPALPSRFSPTKVGRKYVYGTVTVAGLGLRPRVKAPACKEGRCGHRDNSEHLPSTSAKVLKVYHGEHPWIRQFVEYKANVKALQFCDAWIEEEREGRLYGRFNQTGTVTGRLSSSEPNLQNVPSRGPLGRRLRALFRPEKGSAFVHGDYSQLEPRLMAHWSHDPVLMDIFENGKDIYLETARLVYGRDFGKDSQERGTMKLYVLSLGYGAKAKKLRMTLAESGFYLPLAEVTETLDALTEVYHVFFSWKDKVVKEAEWSGYAETLSGHRRHVELGAGLREDARWKIERQTANSVIQGSAADVVQTTMINVDRELPELRLLAQVHDELLGEADLPVSAGLLSDFQRIAEREHGFEIDVPIVFEPRLVRTWAEAKA